MAFRIDWRRDFFRVRIPRICRGTPRWVRAGAAVHRGPFSADGFSRWGMIYGFEVSSKSKRVYSGPRRQPDVISRAYSPYADLRVLVRCPRQESNLRPFA